MKILLAGGGSGGPVSPILAVALEIQKLEPKAEFLFVGTKVGPEKKMVADTRIKFLAIPAAKWRRYFSIRNIFEPLILLAGFFRALFIVREFRPDVVFSAGSFVGVPVCWAAALLHIPIVIHQQDAIVGLSNRLVAPFANQVTTAFEKTSKGFYSGSGLFTAKLKPAAEWVGNPVRPDLFHSAVDAAKFFNLHGELPVLLVLGGATGSAQINKLLGEILPELVKAHQVVHQTGKGKNTLKFSDRDYHPIELIPFAEYAAILNQAHLVVARAGLSTIAELSALGKPAVIIPMPHTHQEENAKILAEDHAAVVLFESEANSENLKRVLNDLKFNLKFTQAISQNMEKLMPKDAALRLAKIIHKLAND